MNYRFEPTGEVRYPRKGEWYQVNCGSNLSQFMVASVDHCIETAPIFRCVPHDPDKPKPLTWEKPTPDMLFGDGDEFLVAVPVKSRHGGKDYYEYSVVRASCDGDDEDARLDFNTDEGNWAWSWGDVEYFIALDRFRLPGIAEKPHDPDDAALVASLKTRIRQLESVLESIRDGYDHEADAHKYNNGACRVCIAEEALKGST